MIVPQLRRMAEMRGEDMRGPREKMDAYRPRAGESHRLILCVLHCFLLRATCCRAAILFIQLSLKLHLDVQTT